MTKTLNKLKFDLYKNLDLEAGEQASGAHFFYELINIEEMGFFVLHKVSLMAKKLVEKYISINGKALIQGRSEEGKLLVVKTDEGYELKCPRSKEVYLIPYEQMVLEYLIHGDNQARKKLLELNQQHF